MEAGMALPNCLGVGETGRGWDVAGDADGR